MHINPNRNEYISASSFQELGRKPVHLILRERHEKNIYRCGTKINIVLSTFRGQHVNH